MQEPVPGCQIEQFALPERNLVSRRNFFRRNLDVESRKIWRFFHRLAYRTQSRGFFGLLGFIWQCQRPNALHACAPDIHRHLEVFVGELPFSFFRRTTENRHRGIRDHRCFENHEFLQFNAFADCGSLVRDELRELLRL